MSAICNFIINVNIISPLIKLMNYSIHSQFDCDRLKDNYAYAHKFITIKATTIFNTL